MTVRDMKRYAYNNQLDIRTAQHGATWGAALYGAWARGRIAISTKNTYRTKAAALRGLARLFTQYVETVRSLP